MIYKSWFNDVEFIFKKNSHHNDLNKRIKNYSIQLDNAFMILILFYSEFI